MSGSFINTRGRDYSAPRVGGGISRPPFGNVGSNGPSWTDSMPRRDFYSNVAPTGSLPRRDKAGLGRPEPNSMGGMNKGNKNDVGIPQTNSINGGSNSIQQYFSRFYSVILYAKSSDSLCLIYQHHIFIIQRN